MTVSTPTRKRLVFWLTPRLSPFDLELCEALSQDGFEVKTAYSIEALEKLSFEIRPAVIALTDHGSQDEAYKLFVGLMNLPDLRAAKMVMVSFFNYETLKIYATGSNFRDIIPAHLPHQQFLDRFRFATATRTMDFASIGGEKRSQDFGLKTELAAKIYLPCRITQLGPQTIKVESRIQPKIGSRLQISGKWTNVLELPSITAEVVEHISAGLIHRFSSGFIAQWHRPPDDSPNPERDEAFWTQIASKANPKETRIFVAMSDAHLRRATLDSLRDPSFILATALQRHSIASEPRYFAPDFVLLDENISLEKNGDTLYEICTQLSPSCQVIATSLSDDGLSKLTNILGDPSFSGFAQRIKIVKKSEFQSGLNLRETISQLLDDAEKTNNPLTKSSHKSDSAHQDPWRYLLKSQDPWTYAQIIVPGQMTAIHHQFVDLILPFSVKSFSILRLHSVDLHKVFNRSPFAKIIEEKILTKPPHDQTLEAQIFYHYRCLFSDLTHEEGHRMAHWALSSLEETLKRRGLLDHPTDKEEPVFDHTGHLDSLSDGKKDMTNIHEDQPDQESPTTHSTTPSTSPSLNQFAEISKEIGREALQGLKDTFEGHETKGWLQSLIPLIFVSGVMLGIIWGLFTYLSKDFNKSGRVYSDQLKNFNP